MKPKLSIIIPCYKSAQTLEETLDSVFSQSYNNWEAIIVNDGSPDNIEEIAEKWVAKDKRFKYFKKENGGLGSARNFGIRKSNGKIILPLDSDNKIKPNFVRRNIKLFHSDEEIGVVYGDAQYFGERNDLWSVGDFNKYRLLDHNYIDACALIRKSLFDDFGYYTQSLPHQGHEDWEFWLRVVASGYKFHYVKEISFDYRVSKDSMIRSFDEKMLDANINYIKQKHYQLYNEAMLDLLKENESLKKKINSGVVIKLQKKLKKIFAKLM